MLTDRRAVVTGGTRGIGRAIAQHLADLGAEVTVTGTGSGGVGPAGTSYAAIDFSDREACTRFAADLASNPPDILINNAGINKISPFADIDPADFDRIHQVNLWAPMMLCRAVVPGMAARKWGRIVNIGSIWGKISIEFRASYSSSKFGLDGMTAALAAEVAASNVLCNCVAPGFVDTDLTRKVLGDDGIRTLTERIPMKRLANPDEIARFVCWLAGPENTYISGQNIAIDGGFTRV